MSVARCEDACYKRAGCVVLKNPYIRDFSPFLTPSGDTAIKSTHEQVFFPVPNSVQMKALQRMMDAIPNDMIKNPTDETWNLGQLFKSPPAPYKLKDLAKAAEIPFGTLDDCYLVRYSDPGSFHIILDQGEYYLKGASWNKQFPGLNFQSGLGLYRGLTFLLSRCMTSEKCKIEDDVYQTGDLVICAVPRQLPSSGSSNGMFGYRGVITKVNVEALFVNANKKADGKMAGTKVAALIVYLLDTGEERLVEKGAGYLAPLPEAFSTFPPLAIPCALHGVSPVGIMWDSRSKQKMRELICPEENVSGDVKLLVEFFSKHRTSTENNAIRKSSPYFVELTACFDGFPSSCTEMRPVSESSVLVSSVLIKNGMALEWNFTPRRAAFCKEIFRPVDSTRLNAEGKCFAEDEIPEEERNDEEERERRGLLLHLVGNGNPVINPKVSEEQLRQDMRHAFAVNSRLNKQVIQFEDSDDFEGNILAMRLNTRDE